MSNRHKHHCIVFYKDPQDMKTRVRSKRGFSYTDHNVWFQRTDKNRRRADWYFERVVNDCLSAWEQSEAFGREMQLKTASKVCDCMDNLTCRCLERLFLVRIITFLKSCSGTHVTIPHLHMVRAWFVAEYGIKNFDRNNLWIVDTWNNFGLEGTIDERYKEWEERGRSRETSIITSSTA